MWGRYNRRLLVISGALTMRPDSRTPTRLLLAPLLALLAACGSPEDKVAGYLEKAEAFLAAEDYKKAAVEAKNAVQIQPKNAQAICCSGALTSSRRRARYQLEKKPATATKKQPR